MHPLSDFRHCPHCGSKRFEAYDDFSKKCGDCGFTFYPNAAAATVGVILNEQDELLCVRRGREPALGTLDLPGGFVDPGESITEGLLREIREEVGGEVIYFRFLFSFPNAYPYSGHVVHTADAFFLCRLEKGVEVSACDDASEIVWLSRQAIKPKLFGLTSVRRGVEHLLKHWP